MIREMRALTVICFAAVTSLGFADNSLLAPGQFLELRSLSGLAGGGFGLLQNGTPSIQGAVSLTTPIGFSLGGGIFDIGAIDRSDNDGPEMINYNHSTGYHSHGTVQLMGGIGTPAGNFTLTYEIVSTQWDQIYNAQWQLPLKLKNGGVSIGVQNFTNRPEASYDHGPGEDADSRSFFAVGTYEVTHGDFVSLGVGTARFKGVFGNASALLTTNLKATLEYDTLAWNAGLAYSFGKIRGLGDNWDHNETTLWLGYLDGENLAIALNFAF
jgi:hypothetical protein